MAYYRIDFMTGGFESISVLLKGCGLFHHDWTAAPMWNSVLNET